MWNELWIQTIFNWFIIEDTNQISEKMISESNTGFVLVIGEPL